MAAPLLTRRRTVAAKIEAAAGTIETLLAAEGAFNVYDPVFEPDISINKRPEQGSHSNIVGIPGSQAGTATFEVELAPSNNAEWADVLLPGAGFYEHDSGGFPDDWRLTTDSANYKTLTLGLFQDGWRYDVYGARGDLTIRGTVGEAVRCAFEYMGIWSAATATLITPTLPTATVPVLDGATFTIGGVTHQLSTFEIALNSQVTRRADVTKASGFLASDIVGRDPTLSVDVEAVTGKDWFVDWLTNRVEAALSIVLTVGGNNVTISASKAQLTDVKPGDRDGLHIYNLSFQLNGSDNELDINFN